MIKLKSILEEIEATATLSKQEKAAYDDLIGSLKEASGKDFLAKVASYAKKGMLKGALLAALLNAPELSNAEKIQVQDLAKDTTTQTVTKAQSKTSTDKSVIASNDTRTGTDVDGINGYFTSQFQFPTAFLKDLNSGKVTHLGHGGNDALQIVNQSGVSVQQMAQWNNFVKWMESKGYSGTKKMDHVEFNKKVLEEYRKINPSFWVRPIYDKEGRNEDIKKVQAVIKAYRRYTIEVWKLGIDKARKQGFQPVMLMDLDPSDPNNVKRVESNYMMWAK